MTSQCFCPKHPPRAKRCRFILICLVIASLGVTFGSSLSAEDTDDTKAIALYADAANFQKGGAIEVAISSWNSFIKQYPKHPRVADAQHFLGICYLQLDNPNYLLAIASFEKALANPQLKDRQESLVNLGWSLFASSAVDSDSRQEQLKKSIVIFEQMLKENTESQFSDRAFFFIGEALYALGQQEKAIDSYNRLLDSDNAKESTLWIDAMYSRGVAHEEKEEINLAVSTYRELLQTCDRPTLVTDVNLRLGDLLLLNENYNEALQRFIAATKSASEATDRAYGLFRQAFTLVQTNQIEQAAKKYQELLSEYPDSSFAGPAQLAAAQSHYRAGNLILAEDGFQEVLKKNDAVAATEAAHWIARIKISEGRFDDAIQVANQQIDSSEGNFKVALRMDLAEALTGKAKSFEEKETAEKEFSAIYQAFPEDALASRALYNATLIAFQINAYPRSLESAKDFITSYPRDPLKSEAQFIKAESELLLGKIEDSSNTFQNLLNSTSQDHPQRSSWVLRAATSWNRASRFQLTIETLQNEIKFINSPLEKAEAYLALGQAQLQVSDNDAALKSFQLSRKQSTDWARGSDSLLLEGQALFQAGKTQQAIEKWLEVAESSSVSGVANQAWYKLAKQASDENNHLKAISFYEKINQTPNSGGPGFGDLAIFAQYGIAWSWMQLRDYEKAVEFFTPLTKDSTIAVYLDALLGRGISNRNLGRNSEARSDFDLLLNLSIQGDALGNALYELALVEIEENNFAKAIELLDQIITRLPQYPGLENVYYELGWAQKSSGQLDGAAASFQSLLDRFPNSAQASEVAYFLGQQGYATQQWSDASKYFQIAFEKAGDQELAEKSIYRMAWSLYNQKSFAESEKIFIKQAAEYGDGMLILDALMMIGECRFQREEYQIAIDAFATAREKIRQRDDNSSSVPDPSEQQVREIVFLHGGQSYAQLKQWKNAIECYDELRERFPATGYLAELFYETGFAHQQLGDNASALTFYREVADNYRNAIAARSRFMIGEIHFDEQKLDEAIPEFQRVMYGFGAENAPAEIKNWQAKSGFEAGRCGELLIMQSKTEQAKQKSLNLARRFYQYVLDQHPTHELASKSRERIEALNVD